MKRDELAREIYHSSHLTGSFLLRSGKTSNEYFDKYQFESNPRLLAEIAEQMAPLIPAKTDLLGAMEMGGIPIATALSLRLKIPTLFIRKEAKEYGTCRFAEGPQFSGKKLTIIEDVITTGGQVAISVAELRNQGASIQDVVCVIDRSEGKIEALQKLDLHLKALFTMDELKKAGLSQQ